MAIPDFQSLMKPLLEVVADGLVHTMKEASDLMAQRLNLTSEDLSERIQSGTQTKYYNRSAWAKSLLLQAGALSSPKRGCFQITDRGRDLINQNHERISIRVLNQYPEFAQRRAHWKNGNNDKSSQLQEIEQNETPDEMLQRGYQAIRDSLAGELLEKIGENSPAFFESLVVDLMVAMGYGGSRMDAGESIGQSGDEGIDGIIKEDKLGLDVIYLQAKRWKGTVGRPEIQKFVGALSGKRAKKGVFITTGQFSNDAVKYVHNIETRVILIDGKDLANYMIDFNIGTSTQAVYDVKRIDSDYFNPEE